MRTNIVTLCIIMPKENVKACLSMDSGILNIKTKCFDLSIETCHAFDSL